MHCRTNFYKVKNLDMTRFFTCFFNFCKNIFKNPKVLKKNADNIIVRNFRKGKKRKFVLVVDLRMVVWVTMNTKC